MRDALNTLLAFEIVALDRLAREHDDDRLLKRLRAISAGSLRANQIENAVAAAVVARAGPDAIRDAFATL